MKLQFDKIEGIKQQQQQQKKLKKIYAQLCLLICSQFFAGKSIKDKKA